MQRVGQAQTRGRIAARQTRHGFRVRAIRVKHGAGDVARPAAVIRDQRFIVDFRLAAYRIVLGVIAIPADDGCMLASQQGERPAGVNVEIVAVLFACAPGARPQFHAFARGGIGITLARIENGGAVRAFRASIAQVHVPVAGQALVQRREYGVLLVGPGAPWRRETGVARQVRQAAVRIPVGYGTPGGACRLVVLEVDAGRQQGAGAHVCLKDDHADCLALVIHVQVGIAFLPRQCRACAHAALGVQRRGEVGFEALIIPAAHDQAGAGLELFRRPFAYHVDGGRRVARAAHQASGAAHHLDAVVQDGVLQRRIAAARHAVNLKIVDAEAARIKPRALGVVLAHLDACRLGQRLVQAHGAQVVEQLARDDADRLRRLAQGQVHARGTARFACRVRLRAFRRRCRLAGHGDGRHGNVGRSGIGGLGRQGHASGKAEQADV